MPKQSGTAGKGTERKQTHPESINPPFPLVGSSCCRETARNQPTCAIAYQEVNDDSDPHSAVATPTHVSSLKSSAVTSQKWQPKPIGPTMSCAGSPEQGLLWATNPLCQCLPLLFFSPPDISKGYMGF